MSESPVASLEKHFASLEDPRVDRTKLHQLLDIIVIAIGASKTAVIGSWTSLSEKMIAESAKAMGPRTSLSCDASPSTCSNRRKPPNAESRRNASRLAGMKLIFLRC